jgi:hypothetical protein
MRIFGEDSSGDFLMQGLEISEKYFLKFGAPMIETQFPDYKNRIAAGLIGDGSDCYGFDDEISRDHDWGPGFCLWLNKKDYSNIGLKLEDELKKLPSDFEGFSRQVSEWGEGRIGVFEIGQFYRKFTGFDHLPANNREWRAIPEQNLAAATNGKVFIDPSGEFSAFREGLKKFYPEDVRLKKMASRCMTIARCQYNYMRCAMRKEEVAASCVEAEFCNDVISLVFLLNRQYKPFFKWMHRAVKSLPTLGETIYQNLLEIVTSLGHVRKNHLINETCYVLIEELRKQGLSTSPSDSLLDHGPIIQSGIKDPDLRNLNVWLE